MPSLLERPRTSSHLPLHSSARRRALTDDQAKQLLSDHRLLGMSTVKLAARYGISQQTAHRIVTGRAYAELYKPRNAHVEWVEPTVRRRGFQSAAEMNQLMLMLKSHPEKWALVKQTKLLSDTEPYSKHGFEVSQVLMVGGGYGVYIRCAVTLGAVA